MHILTKQGYQSLGHLLTPALNNPRPPAVPSHIRSIWSQDTPEAKPGSADSPLPTTK